MDMKELKELKVEFVHARNLKPHEEVDPKRLDALKKVLLTEGLALPILVDRESKTLLDGHHRFAALKELGVEMIPICYVDYGDESIVLEARNGQSLTKKEVIAVGASNNLFPRKTTRHLFLLETGLVHSSTVLPGINLSLSKLRKIA